MPPPILAGTKTVQVPIPRESADPKVIAQLQANHHLAGLCIRPAAGKPPILLFAFDGQSAPAASDFFVIWYGWETTFGGTLTITWMSKAARARVFVAAGTPEFEALRPGRFVAVPMWKGRAIAAFEVDASGVTGELEFARHWRNAANHQPVLPDAEAAYWETTSDFDVLEDYFTPADRLSIGWAKRYGRIARSAQSFIKNETKGRAFPPPISEEGSTTHGLGRFLTELRGGEATPLRLMNAAQAVHEQGDLALLELLTSHAKYLEVCHGSSGADAHPHCSFYDFSLDLYFLSSGSTHAGRRVCWLDLEATEFKVSHLEIRPQEFPTYFRPEDYWERVHDSHGVGLGRHVAGVDVPIDLGPESKAWDTFPLAADPDEADAAAKTLIEEAVASKCSCIPNGAVLQLRFGPFEYVQVWESTNAIEFVWRTNRGEFATSLIDLPEKKLVFDALQLADPEKCDAMRAGVFLVLAAILRDFCVVEERETVFRVEEVRKGPACLRTTDGSPRIVYLPRVRYRDNANLDRLSRELDQEARRAHFVSGHLRKSEASSDHQLILARRYGMAVPTGYTFVRPHHRGEQARAVVYRSRSALRSLYEVDGPTTGKEPVQWFQFERDVQAIMRKLGFSVEHVAAARAGDDGVDVFARKGADLNELNWLIQCKCFAPDRKVGPAVIRELLGALKAHPQGVRGMVVTTSRFTSGARELADQHGIRMMDGAEFARRLAEN